MEAGRQKPSSCGNSKRLMQKSICICTTLCSNTLSNLRQSEKAKTWRSWTPLPGRRLDGNEAHHKILILLCSLSYCFCVLACNITAHLKMIPRLSPFIASLITHAYEKDFTCTPSCLPQSHDLSNPSQIVRSTLPLLQEDRYNTVTKNARIHAASCTRFLAYLWPEFPWSSSLLIRAAPFSWLLPQI